MPSSSALKHPAGRLSRLKSRESSRSQKNYREGSRQLPELRLPELVSWYERVAVPSVLVRSHRCSRTPPRPHGSINDNEKEETPWNRPCRSRPSSPQRPAPKLPHVRFFAGFT